MERAVDQYGQVIDVLVPAPRDDDAARRFFRRPLSPCRHPPGRHGVRQHPVRTRRCCRPQTRLGEEPFPYLLTKRCDDPP
ncbi:DDE-type integrase/transposase/recombinase [Micromonospora tarensis]|uniref:DDE-type integrase/transposase/recombinase n=1 Tax=Micromonospora tarensis TaxID=2806100 RepID=UPI00389933BD